MKWLLFIGFYFALSANVIAQEVPNSWNENISYDSFDELKLSRAVFYFVNIERLKKRLAPVEWSEQLYQGALFHSQQMCELNFFDHVNRTLKKARMPVDRAKMFGFDGSRVGENILEEILLDYKDNQIFSAEKIGDTYQYFDLKTGKQFVFLTYLQMARKMVSAWMNSPPHKANILSKNYCFIGVGCSIVSGSAKKLPVVLSTQLFGV